MGDVIAGKTWAGEETVTPQKLNDMFSGSKLAVGIVQLVQAEILEQDYQLAEMPSLGVTPTIADGVQIMEQAITPRDVNSKVLVVLTVQVRQYGIPNESNGGVSVALFRGNTCLGVRYIEEYNAAESSPQGGAGVITFVCLDSPSSGSPVTYSARAGAIGTAREIDVNNIAGASLGGGPALLLEFAG